MNKTLRLVTTEQAEKLKRLDFDWLPEYTEEGTQQLPSVPLALKWIRDEKDIDYGFEYRLTWCECKVYRIKNEIVEIILLHDQFTDYENAESAVLNRLLDFLIKNNKKKSFFEKYGIV